MSLKKLTWRWPWHRTDVRQQVGAESLLTEYDAPRRERYELHLGLFLLTLASTIYAGGLLVGRGVVYEAEGLSAFLLDGARYAFPFLFFLTVHEFGHYLAARRHQIDVSLPYFIPIPLPLLSFGTLGAVIRIREPLRRTRQLFDVGAAGPLAGFVVALGLLAYALASLPPPAYLLDVPHHEPVVRALLDTGRFPPLEMPSEGTVLLFNDTLLISLVRELVPGVPSPSELMHYPVLLAAWLGLFFTALNLLPVGQLDGGHVVYALFGARTHAIVARVFTLLLLVSGTVGFVRDALPGLEHMSGSLWLGWAVLALILVVLLRRLLGALWLVLAAGVSLIAFAYSVILFLPALAEALGYSGWLLWVGLIVFIIRVDHPPVLVHEPLTPGRRALGYLCLLLFVLCFSIRPILVISAV